MLFSKAANLLLIPAERTGSQAIELGLRKLLPDLSRTSKYSRHCMSGDDFELVLTESPDVDSLRIVATARNPVDRFISCYNKRMKVFKQNKGESVAYIIWGYGRFWKSFSEFVKWHIDTKDVPISEPTDYLDWQLHTPGKRLETGEPLTDFRQLIPQSYLFGKLQQEIGREPDFIVRQESLAVDLAKISAAAASIEVDVVDATASNRDQMYYEGLEDDIKKWQADEFTYGGYE